jgi:hypothetical protein
MQVFADPAVRSQVRQWHLDNVAFLDMVDRLGLSAVFVGALRDATANLKPDEVATIRKAFLAAIDAAGDTEGACYPVACGIGDRVTGPITVTELDKGGVPWAKVVAS